MTYSAQTMPRGKTSRSPAGLGTVPLFFALPYLFLTFLLFFIGPYDWPLRAWWVVYAYIPATFALLSIGFWFAARMPGEIAEPTSMKLYYVVGGISAVVLLLPSALIYTDRYPWEVVAALEDQREAYSSLARQLEETEGARGPFALLRAVLAPFTFCVLPFAIIYWSRLSNPYRLLAGLVVLASIDLSILRGTTRELADLIIVGVSAYLVSLGRSSLERGINLAEALRTRWKALVIPPLLVIIVIMTLVGRTEARLGGANIGCIGERSGVCVTASEPYNSMPDAAYFGLATVTAYFSQGYYGLALAGEQDFDSTFGVGHSPAVSALYILLSGDHLLPERAYTARLGSEGWNDTTQWSTLLAWIANDIGFGGALIFILLLGFTWGRAWIMATQGKDDRSAVFFCALMMMVFYLPANNQMMGTFDGYATLLFWGFASMLGSKKSV